MQSDYCKSLKLSIVFSQTSCENKKDNIKYKRITVYSNTQIQKNTI